MKLNTDARKRVAKYTEFFKSNGYEEGEARALASAYYRVLCDRFLRTKAVKELKDDEDATAPFDGEEEASPEE